MQMGTVYESTSLRVPSIFPNLLKEPFQFHEFRPFFGSFRPNSSSSRRRFRPMYCRVSSNQLRHTCNKQSGYSRQMDFRLFSCSSCQITRGLVDTCDKFNVLEQKDDDCMTMEVCFPKISLRQLLTFGLLFGSLTLQGVQQAFAASDFSDVFHPDFFVDLTDTSSGFASAFLLIFFSELGDKTFFIAALLAARNPAAVVFTGTFGALAVMTIISVVLGRTFHYIDGLLPFRFGGTDLPIDDIAAVILLLYFGASTLIDAASGDGLKAEDEQKEAELAVSEFSGNGAGILAAAGTVISTFLLVFVAEWGDKSFFSTIALAAASSPLGVIGGALAGHGVATLLAVLGGSFLGSFLSEKVISYTGGILFLVFAAITLVEIIRG